jgi:hypothetical protein
MQTFPQTYFKGDQARVVTNPAGAVKAKFDGFRPAGGTQSSESDSAAASNLARARESAPAASQSAPATSPAQPDELAEEPAPATPSS